MDEIIIQKIDDVVLIVVLENGNIVEFYEDDLKVTSKMGNIYLGKIKDILRKNNTIFVDYGEEKAGFLQLEEIPQDYEVGEKIIVQVKRDEIEQKGAKLTQKLSIFSRGVVLLQDPAVYTVSRKISWDDIDESLVKELDNYREQGYGIILRTEAENTDESAILSQLKKAKEKLDDIIKNGKNHEEPMLLHNANLIEKKIYENFCKITTKKIYINDAEIYNKLLKEAEIQKEFYEEKLPQIIFENGQDFIKEFGLETEFEKAKNSKVWLKSGGYLIIEKTEALTSIDVNSGKYVGTAENNEIGKFIFKTNEEAAIESAKQIRVKNLSGIIFVDFINMQNDDERARICNIFEEEAKHDRSRVEVFGFTKLGLLEITRKKL